MNVKENLNWIVSNKLFVVILLSAIALISVALSYYLTFPYLYHVEPQQVGATILGILVAIFVLFFASTQILYSVSEIPTKLLLKYSLRTKEPFSLIIYFLAAIFICSLAVSHYPVVNGTYFLLATLFWSLIIITCYFYWFTKRITPEGIIEQITLTTDRCLRKVNRFEKIRDPEYSAFQEFIRKSIGQYQYDVSYCIYESLFEGREPSFTVLAREQKDRNIGKIDVIGIGEKLSKITFDHHVKIIFEVEPTLPIPKKDPYEPMVHNYRLITIVFKKKETEQESEYERAQKAFVEKIKGSELEIPKNDTEKYVAAEVRKILSKAGSGLEVYFDQNDYGSWTNKAETAFNDLKSMFDYNLKNEEIIDPLCAALEKIIQEQFFALRPHIFLHIRYNLFRKIGEMFNEINETSLREDDTHFFENMLSLYYKLAVSAAESKSSIIYEEILGAIRYFHILFVKTAPHSYNSIVEILVLNISELTTLIIREKFEKEKDLDSLDRFYKPVFHKGLNTAFNVVRDYLDWYNEDKLHSQIYLKKQAQHFINFIPYYKDRPAEYFSDQSEYYKIKRQLKSPSAAIQDKQAFDLAVKKAAIVSELKDKLQIKIMQLSICMVKRYMDKELDPEIIWKIALPASKNSCYEHGLKSFFTRRFNDYKWQDETQDLFLWQEIHPAGAHELHRFNLDIFWIILNVYLGHDDFFPVKAKKFLKDRLLVSFKFIDANFWANALNMSLKVFNDRINQYENSAKEIKLEDKEETESNFDPAEV